MRREVCFDWQDPGARAPAPWLNIESLQYTDDARIVSMTTVPDPRIPSPLDPATRALVRLAAAAAGGAESAVRRAVADAVSESKQRWVEEVVLQTYLFAGFPRALNAAREWRRALGGGGATAPAVPEDDLTDYARAPNWRAKGEATCAIVYGPAYDKLRENIRALHPALDAWMIVEGYGKVLSRPQLDLGRRELCIVAACAATSQERQLHSHLHGAMYAGAGPDAVDGTFDALPGLLTDDQERTARLLWARVRAHHASPG